MDGEGRLLAASVPARALFGITDRHIGDGLVHLEERLRPTQLRLAVEDARATGRPSRVEELQLPGPEGTQSVVNVDVRPLLGTGGTVERLILWVEDVTREQELVVELSRLRQELETTSEELQTTNEELETTNEELQSTNEELETTNEELQSTNEELETTIEELQSTNEELETANDELRARQEDLNERDRFQTMVLSSLRMGVIVVWSIWEVVSWNKTCEELWGAREEEVVGHNLFSLDTGMPFESLRKALLAVMQGGESSQVMEVDAVNRRGRAIRCRIRALPLVETAGGASGVMLLIDNAAENA
jgi:two-component system CheB/CheR fusion protein